jgi:hypothetical protein
LPRAKYAVRLVPRGTLEHAGLTEDLRQTGSFEDILKAEDSTGVSVTGDDIESSGTTLRDEIQGTVVVVEETPTLPKAPPKKLIEEEKRETGSVKKGVYYEYLMATGGFPFWAVVILAYFIAEGFTLARSWWIKVWTSSYEHSQDKLTQAAHSYTMQAQFLSPPKVYSFLPTMPAKSSLVYYLGIYVAISLSSVLMSALRSYLVYRGGVAGSRRIFKEMTDSVLRTPLRWLDTVPTGRILNRFTADFQSLDSQLSLNFAGVAQAVLDMIGILVAA